MEQFFSHQGEQHPNEAIQITPALREYGTLPPQTAFLGLVMTLGGLCHKSISISHYPAMVSFPDPNNYPLYFWDLLLRISISFEQHNETIFFFISQILEVIHQSWKEIKEANWVKLLQQSDGRRAVFKVNWNSQYQWWSHDLTQQSVASAMDLSAP